MIKDSLSILLWRGFYLLQVCAVECGHLSFDVGCNGLARRLILLLVEILCDLPDEVDHGPFDIRVSYLSA